MHEFLQKTVLNALYYSGTQAATGFWTGGVGAILMLHHVREDCQSRFAPNRHLQVAPNFLDKVLTSIGRSGMEFVSLNEMSERFESGKIDRSRKMIAITLDDGYRDNLQNAVPLFRKHNAPYTIFIAPGLVEGSADLWWEDLSAIIASRDQIRITLPNGHCEFDVSTLEKKHEVFNRMLAWLTTKVSEEEQRNTIRELAWMYKIDTAAHSRNQIMTWSQISDLAKDPLCSIGAHSIHHYSLARLDRVDAAWEMRESAKILEAEIGLKPRHFAFPYGYPAAAGPREFEIARELGFKTALTTRHGVLRQSHVQHLHALPRISLNGNFQTVRYVNTLLSGLPTLMQNGGRWLNVG